MDSQRLSNWIQLITAVAVLAGLTLVVFELRQAKELTQAQIVAEAFTRGVNLQLSKMAEDPRSALFKAEFRPDELTAEDAVTLDSYYAAETMMMLEMRLSDQIAGMDRRWRRNIAGMAEVVFGSKPARRWFEVQKEDQLPPEIAEIIRNAIESSDRVQKDRYTAILGKESSILN